MSLFAPNMHWQVNGQVVEFDAATQKGKVQLIGVYGKDHLGNPVYTDVESEPNYAANNPFLKDYIEVKVSYTPGEWVVVMGIPSGPLGPENPKDLLAGIHNLPYKQKYFILGSLSWKNESESRKTQTVNKKTDFKPEETKDFVPRPENFDHKLQMNKVNPQVKFPPIEYEYLPHEDASGGTT